MKTISNQSMIIVSLLIATILVSSFLVYAIGVGSSSSQVDGQFDIKIAGEPSGCGCGDPIVKPPYCPTLPPWVI